MSLRFEHLPNSGLHTSEGLATPAVMAQCILIRAIRSATSFSSGRAREGTEQVGDHLYERCAGGIEPGLATRPTRVMEEDMAMPARGRRNGYETGGGGRGGPRRRNP